MSLRKARTWILVGFSWLFWLCETAMDARTVRETRLHNLLLAIESHSPLVPKLLQADPSMADSTSFR